MSLDYRHTRIASYIGYITQGIVNNLSPLLFVTFSEKFDISLAQISALIVINFGVQIVIDTLAAFYADKVGMKNCAVFAHIFAAAGLAGLGTLPFIMPPYAGIIISVTLSAIGGGLCEVVVSPIIESLPFENKAANMNLLHSFYCWGQVGVVLISTLFFTLCGIDNWRWLALAWAVIPALNAVYFSLVPVNALCEPDEKMKLSQLVSSPAFLLFFLLMFCSGAAELAMSQWASYFAEQGLHISKTAGDLLGPCMFAFFMGISRVCYATLEKRFSLQKLLVLSSALCIATYLVAALSPFPTLALVGCSLCGASVGMMWPGVLSLCSRRFSRGGESMFAVLAIAGDVGCTFGPWVVGMAAQLDGKMQTGLLLAVVFPAVMLFGCLKLRRK